MTVGTTRWKIAAAQRFTAVAWVPVSEGSFAACLPLDALASASIQLLANTVHPSSDSPGGLVNVSARIPLATSGSGSGQWEVPPDAIPSTVGGLILQISSSTAGTVDVTTGGTPVHLAVGPAAPASTVLLSGGTPAWTSSSGVAPDALLLGFVTSRDDGTTGGALVNTLPKAVGAGGETIRIARRPGLPNVDARIPATSVLANIKANNPAVQDSLAAGRLTATGATRKQSTQTLLRVANDGAVHLTAKAHLSIVAWLGGDVIRAPDTIDLTLPGAPAPRSMPSAHVLEFAGHQSFRAGETLMVGVTPSSPNGLIASVDSVSAGGRATTVHFHDGGLLDAFSQLTLVAQVPVAPDGTAPEAAANGARISEATPLSVSASLGFSASRSFQLSPSLSGQVSFHFAPSVTLAITVGTGWLGLPSSVSLHYAVDASSSVTATLTAQAGASAQATFALGRLSLAPFSIGPVVVVPELTSNLTVSADFSAAVSLSGSVTEHAHSGMTMTAGGSRGFSFYGDSNNGWGSPQFAGASLEASISAQAQAALTFQFNLLAYGQVGPDARVTATIGLQVTPFSTPKWQVTASGDFGIGLNLNALNVSVVTSLLRLLGINTNPNWSIGHLGPYVVASGSGGTIGGPGTGPGGGGSSQGPTTGTGGGGGGGGGGRPLTSAPPGASATVAQGPAAPFGYRYAVSLHGYVPNSAVGITCVDTQDPSGFYYFTLATDGAGNASTASYCYSATGPEYWVIAGGLASNHARWSSGGGTPPAPGAAVQIGWSAGHPGWIYMALSGFPPGSYQYTCQFASGGNASFTLSVASSPVTFDNGHTCFDLQAGDTVSVSVASVQSNSVTVGGAPPQKGTGETVGGVTNTWSNYANAGGTQGPAIQSNQTVAVSCRVQGLAVADGNNWWYRISTSPWSNSFYASADAFYNNGRTSGSLIGTPFVDPAIATCSTAPPPPPTNGETTGGLAHTWTNYLNAGGTEGPSIPSNATVQITCALHGFPVADGNTWWYRIGSSPWNNAFYVSADAFYNNGQTSGPLAGTPFVDPAVPLCASLGGHTETTGGATNTWTNYTNAGGSQGPTIPTRNSVQVTCVVQGFPVADGNNLWYQIGSSPWNNAYYASADAFYNNGQTSGPLAGTPFVDPAVPHC
ncbi:MAG: hypothetical protein ACXVKQ_06305 [Acidimicrobiia bacterium]